MNKIIGIPNQNYHNAKTREAIEKAELAQKEKQYHVGIRLELARDYPLEKAKRMYLEVLSDKPYPDISFWFEALKLYASENYHSENFLNEEGRQKIDEYYDFLKNSK